MINARNELIFIYLNLKAFVNFKIKSFFASIIYGHFVRKNMIRKYFSDKNKKIKVHLGANKDIKNFLNSQILGKIPINITKKLPFKNQTVDVIFSTHVVEHIHRKEIDFFISESFRVLKKDGLNIICTPSLKKIIDIVYLHNIEKKELLFKRQDKWYQDNIKTACHQINMTMRNFGHRFLVDDEYMSWLSKKNQFSSCNVVSIDNIPDEDIKKYILEDKDEVWDAESDIYVLKKN
jgi:predicted SAM-dependent methyltransferase